MGKILWMLTGFLLIACNQNHDKKQLKKITNTFRPLQANGNWFGIEEFDYIGLPDSAKWSYDTEGNQWGWGNNEAQHYTANDSSNAFVENGVLTITARIDSMGGKRYTSARLITKGKGDWLYGRFEIRAKLPTGRGTWPAIWMLPTDWEYGAWPNSGEIDIMEYYRINNEPHLLANVAWGTDERYKAEWRTRTVPFRHFLEKTAIGEKNFMSGGWIGMRIPLNCISTTNC